MSAHDSDSISERDDRARDVDGSATPAGQAGLAASSGAPAPDAAHAATGEPDAPATAGAVPPAEPPHAEAATHGTPEGHEDTPADMLDVAKMDERDSEGREDALGALDDDAGVHEVSAPQDDYDEIESAAVAFVNSAAASARPTGMAPGDPSAPRHAAPAHAEPPAAHASAQRPRPQHAAPEPAPAQTAAPSASRRPEAPGDLTATLPVTPAAPAGPVATPAAPGPDMAADVTVSIPAVGVTPPAPRPAPTAAAPQASPSGQAPDADGDDDLGGSESPSETVPFAPVKPITRESVSASGHSSGSGRATGALVWGAATNVGHVREHNEDSYLINFPLFAVADGMGGHAAGEVASTIAVSSLAECGVTKADPYALGSAIEQANQDVIAGAARGVGRQGMGTTCTAVVIDGNRMAVGHVGDSRAYLLHGGKLLRVTHDHSLVEELVEAGKITPEEARVHPNRSVITRALGSDPNMRADAFTVDVTVGDRVLLCSDGLSSMVTDDVIEEALVSSPTASACSDRLVELALRAGGLDNVTVVVIDVVDDGIERHALRNRVRNVLLWLLAVLLVLAAITGGLFVFASSRWYLTDTDGYVSLNRGIPGSLGPITFSEQVEVTNIQVSYLSEAVEDRLRQGISFGSEDAARETLEKYRATIASQEEQRNARTPSSASSSDSDGTAAPASLTAVRPASSSSDARSAAGSASASASSSSAASASSSSDSSAASSSNR